jgi:hypothetical protein
MGKATRYYREQCARHGWEPAPEQIIYRANMLVAETDEDAQALLRAQPGTAPFAMRAGVRNAIMTLDSRNIAGEARTPNVGGALPTTFVGAPDTVVEQVRRCREVVGAGVSTCPCIPGPGDLARSCARSSCSGRGCRASRHLRATSVTRARDGSVRSPGAAFREGFVDADGFRIRYMETGRGTPLVHLHGAGGLRLTRGHDLLSRHFRVVAFEMPGFGQSPENTRTRSMPELASTMGQAAKNLGLDTFNLLGTSFGGKTALWLALQAPERVLALVWKPRRRFARKARNRRPGHPRRSPAGSTHIPNGSPPFRRPTRPCARRCRRWCSDCADPTATRISRVGSRTSACRPW